MCWFEQFEVRESPEIRPVAGEELRRAAGERSRYDLQVEHMRTSHRAGLD
jgi:hypothetical protein